MASEICGLPDSSPRPTLEAATLRILAYHIVAVTLLGVGLLLAGVAIRTGLVL